MTDTALSDREWIAANPTRRYRIRHVGQPDAGGLVLADVTSFGIDRNTWSRQRITMRFVLPDTDVAAELALMERSIVGRGQADH